MLENSLSHCETFERGEHSEALFSSSIERRSTLECWYAVSVRPRHEKLVAPASRAQGIELLSSALSQRAPLERSP